MFLFVPYLVSTTNSVTKSNTKLQYLPRTYVGIINQAIVTHLVIGHGLQREQQQVKRKDTNIVNCNVAVN